MPTKQITRSAYGPKKNQLGKPAGESKTKQSFKNECDINHIMAKYQKTGLVDHIAKNAPRYGFAPSIDFHTAQNLILEAQTQFDGLPSKIRAKFDNSPQKFLAFCEDPNNRSEMALLGLLAEEATPAVSDPEKASDSASAPVPTPPETTPTPE